MKKTLLLFLFISFSFGYTQKKKSPKITANSTILASIDNVSAEYVISGKQKKIVLYVTSALGKETLLVRENLPLNFSALNFKITSFKAASKKMYYIHWEESHALHTKLKQEDQNITVSQIWDIDKKTLLIDNIDKKVHIIEKVYLDRNKTASETQEKNRREGFEFTLLGNGDFLLKNKTQNTTYIYDGTNEKYVPFKTTLNTSNTNKSNKRKR